MRSVPGVIRVFVNSSTNLVTVDYNDEVSSVNSMETALNAGGYRVQEVIYPNRPPIADAGADFALDENQPGRLDGSRSTDPDNDSLTYYWRQISGKSVTITNANQAIAGFMAPEVASDSIELVFELEVTDPLGEKSTASVKATVFNTTPPLPVHTEISAQEAKAMIDAGETLIIVDIRDRDPHCQGHIPGAINYPYSTGEFEQQYANLPPSQKIMIVSQDGQTSHAAAILLDEQRYVAVYDMNGGMNAWLGEVAQCDEYVKVPPIAIAGPAQTVAEGLTVMLDGSAAFDPKGSPLSYRWTSTAGIILSTPNQAAAYFVAPAVGAEGTVITFTLTVENIEGLSHAATVDIAVSDNGIVGFPDELITFRSAMGTALGIRIEGGSLIKLSVIDPGDIPASSDKPESMPHGLIELEVKTDVPGAEVKANISFSEPAETDGHWSQYLNANWSNFAQALFNAARDSVTLTFTDGGAGDEDGAVNGIARNISGLNQPLPQPVETDDDDGGSSSNCFIQSVFKMTSASEN